MKEKGVYENKRKGVRENTKTEKKRSRAKKGKKGKGGEEMQHLRQRNRGEDERFGSFEGNTSQDGK